MYNLSKRSLKQPNIELIWYGFTFTTQCHKRDIKNTIEVNELMCSLTNTLLDQMHNNNEHLVTSHIYQTQISKYVETIIVMQ